MSIFLHTFPVIPLRNICVHAQAVKARLIKYEQLTEINCYQKYQSQVLDCNRRKQRCVLC